LRTMQLLTEEIGLADTVDPLGGSYYVETLTNEMEDKIVEAMDWVESQGGIIKAVSEGVIQAKVSEHAFQRQKDLESGAYRKVGVNCYVDESNEQPDVELHPYDEDGDRLQREALQQVRSDRNQAEVDLCLETLRSDAQAGRNVMNALVSAVKAYASVGEMTSVLIDVYGHYDEPIRF